MDNPVFQAIFSTAESVDPSAVGKFKKLFEEGKWNKAETEKQLILLIEEEKKDEA